jgi:peptidyl-prolyl cis-trans isomerase B (cyclophilin B)
MNNKLNTRKLVVLAMLTALCLFGCEEKVEPFNPDSTYYADIVIKDYGTITVKLDQSAAPVTVENFVKLARQGYYNGLTFHRIIEGFMMQGGAPTGNKKQADSIVGEFSTNGYENPLKHTRGAISMARTNNPNSASSQFFIVHKDYPSLDGKYACFGYVTEGIEIVDRICEESQPTDGNGSNAKAQQPVIETINIREIKAEQ